MQQLRKGVSHQTKVHVVKSPGAFRTTTCICRLTFTRYPIVFCNKVEQDIPSYDTVVLDLGEAR